MFRLLKIIPQFQHNGLLEMLESTQSQAISVRRSLSKARFQSTQVECFPVNTALYDKEIRRHYLNGHYLDDQLQSTHLMRAAARKAGTDAGVSIL